MQPDQHLVIIGNGIAGITLAQQLRKKSSCQITLISTESANHFSRPALMYIYMGHMRFEDTVPYKDWYYQEQKLNRIQDKVIAVDFDHRTLKLEKGDPIQYDILVFATGSCPSFYNWPGLELKGVQGLVTLQDLQRMEEQTTHIKQAVIVGGGLIGIEMAEMLRSRGVEVTMLVREKLFWNANLPPEEASLITTHIREHHINLLLQHELDEIIGDEQGNVKAVKTKNGKTLPCQFVGIATGVKPNIHFLKGSEVHLDKGILVDEYFKTNIDNVYAIGDCAQFLNPLNGSPAIEQLWYTARLHGEALATNFAGSARPYERGPWFNSAKFLDIEFQTYGIVPAQLNNSTTKSLYWEHSNKRKAIRIVFDSNTEKVLGINLLGVRYRHDLCHYWLKNSFSIHQVMSELSAANFDTEFFRHFEPALQDQYLSLFPDRKVSKSNWWNLREQYHLYRSNTKALHPNE